jgi:hypothetical protein
MAIAVTQPALLTTVFRRVRFEIRGIMVPAVNSGLSSCGNGSATPNAGGGASLICERLGSCARDHQPARTVVTARRRRAL